jgi:hypothetical protein
MERTDWLDTGIDGSQARFLMLTAITHHNFGSPAWGEGQVRQLYAELTAIDAAAAQVIVVDRSSSRGRSLSASRAFPVAHPVDNPPASRLSRLLRWLRLGFGRDRDARRTPPSISPADRPTW